MGIAGTTPTATIHQFPNRPEARDRLARLRVKPQPQAAAPVICEGGWYHEEAIEEDRLQRDAEPSLSH